jgi:hypothetical protein
MPVTESLGSLSYSRAISIMQAICMYYQIHQVRLLCTDLKNIMTILILL